MTNNHQAHGPVSLDRLHQIREILSKASAQSDGGNLGYAMADAVKVIDEVLNAEPVAYMTYKGYLLHAADPKLAEYSDPTPLYDAPPAPTVPEELLSAMEEVLRISDRDHDAWHKVRNGIASCRAAMLQSFGNPEQLDEVGSWSNHMNTPTAQAGNSPVTPDGWQLVPKEPTAAMNKAGWAAMNEHDAINPTYKAMLASAPQQEDL
ncbi:hypothetical protein MKK42_18100 [Escherichia coli]|uniref:hypothetical protein n=1 Tax=Escherichia coli TaxID=562 RepID=UPI001F5975A2|nr:hypothetical protein [Escherichia coli]MCI2234008.1 hypothetical protein [Escherichia coli]